MNSGSAPQTTMSSTTIATRSMPMVSWRSIACAIATLVPTPSVEVASSRSGAIRNKPANPPSPPCTSGRVERSRPLINSTAASPASMSTPAAAYVADPSKEGPSDLTRALNNLSEPSRGIPVVTFGQVAGSRAVEGVGGTDAGHEYVEVIRRRIRRSSVLYGRRGLAASDLAADPLQHVLAQQFWSRQVDRVVAGEAGPAQPLGRHRRRL